MLKKTGPHLSYTRRRMFPSLWPLVPQGHTAHAHARAISGGLLLTKEVSILGSPSSTRDECSETRARNEREPRTSLTSELFFFCCDENVATRYDTHTSPCSTCARLRAIAAVRAAFGVGAVGLQRTPGHGRDWAAGARTQAPLAAGRHGLRAPELRAPEPRAPELRAPELRAPELQIPGHSSAHARARKSNHTCTRTRLPYVRRASTHTRVRALA
jgi:hypothetical protein